MFLLPFPSSVEYHEVQFSSVHIFISHKSKHTKKFDYIS